MNEGALATLDADKAIEQLSQGRMLKQIAADYGVTKPAVYKRLKGHPDYKQAIIDQAESLVEIATEQVFNCDADTVNIARARVDAAHKWAAARDPARWGPKQQIDINHSINIDVSLKFDAGNLLEHVAAPQHAQVIDAIPSDDGVTD